jgi:tripartite ATP-independent transporter DctM subunit
MGIFTPKTVSIGDLFLGAIVPGLLLVCLYCVYILATSHSVKALASSQSKNPADLSKALKNLFPPIMLIIAVLGSILGGLATPTEAAGVGAFGATLLAVAKGKLTGETLNEVARNTVQVTSMVFFILIGAAIFSLVFRGFGGDALVEDFFESLPGGVFSATLIVMIVIFILGFILDFIEITFVVVPIVGPVLLAMGLDPVWLGVMIAINLQTSFLTPPFGFALFYLRGVAPPSVATSDMYKGVIPFIMIQILVLIAIAIWPAIATWLPGTL